MNKPQSPQTQKKIKVDAAHPRWQKDQIIEFIPELFGGSQQYFRLSSLSAVRL